MQTSLRLVLFFFVDHNYFSLINIIIIGIIIDRLIIVLDFIRIIVAEHNIELCLNLSEIGISFTIDSFIGIDIKEIIIISESVDIVNMLNQLFS
jgi:hypothetical protein